MYLCNLIDSLNSIKEIQLANIVLETLCSELGENNFVPYDIQGAQFLQDQLEKVF